MYYWNFGLVNGKPVLVGYFDTEAEAAEAGFNDFDGGNFDSYPLNTKDRARATQMVKYLRHEGGLPLSETIEPIGHQTAR